MAFETRISKGYEGERSWIERIPETFDIEGSVVQAKARRNTLKRVEHGGREYCIKSFHIPSALNRIVYTYIRKPKASRSYEHAEELLSAGFGTPEPVAILTEKKGGLIRRSYYVCRQLSDDYREIRDFYFGPLAGNEKLLGEFAQYSAALHERGIYHLDYSPGNILWRQSEDGSYDFQLVDINRMEFGGVDIEKGCRNFARLFESDDIYRHIAGVYADARGFNREECEALIMKYQRAFLEKKERKNAVKKLMNRDAG